MLLLQAAAKSSTGTLCSTLQDGPNTHACCRNTLRQADQPGARPRAAKPGRRGGGPDGPVPARRHPRGPAVLPFPSSWFPSTPAAGTSLMAGADVCELFPLLQGLPEGDQAPQAHCQAQGGAGVGGLPGAVAAADTYVAQAACSSCMSSTPATPNPGRNALAACYLISAMPISGGGPAVLGRHG